MPGDSGMPHQDYLNKAVRDYLMRHGYLESAEVFSRQLHSRRRGLHRNAAHSLAYKGSDPTMVIPREIRGVDAQPGRSGAGRTDGSTEADDVARKSPSDDEMDVDSERPSASRTFDTELRPAETETAPRNLPWLMVMKERMKQEEEFQGLRNAFSLSGVSLVDMISNPFYLSTRRHHPQCKDTADDLVWSTTHGSLLEQSGGDDVIPAVYSPEYMRNKRQRARRVFGVGDEPWDGRSHGGLDERLDELPNERPDERLDELSDEPLDDHFLRGRHLYLEPWPEHSSGCTTLYNDSSTIAMLQRVTDLAENGDIEGLFAAMRSVESVHAASADCVRGFARNEHLTPGALQEISHKETIASIYEQDMTPEALLKRLTPSLKPRPSSDEPKVTRRLLGRLLQSQSQGIAVHLRLSEIVERALGGEAQQAVDEAKQDALQAVRGMHDPLLRWYWKRQWDTLAAVGLVRDADALNPPLFAEDRLAKLARRCRDYVITHVEGGPETCMLELMQMQQAVVNKHLACVNDEAGPR